MSLMRMGRRALLVGAAGLATVLTLSIAPAHAERGQTVETVINIPAMVLDNLCNDAEPVALSGDLHIVTTTTPTSNGGYNVRSSSIADDLRGTGLVSMVPYEGADGENSRAYYAPPPYPSSWRVMHWTVLVPQGPVPSEYLVILLRETVAWDGAVVPTLERVYLTCSQPEPGETTRE